MEYIVTHGTGTKLGDPVEINALAEAFKDYTEEKSYCALTSTKPNIGHTLAASGVVSLISLVMSLKKETIPASINCEQVNDYIQWENSPFFINRENRKWTDKEGKNRLGAVSSFGMSGTNAHVVLQSYTPESTVREKENTQNDKPYYLLVLSAKTPEALQGKIHEMAGFLEKSQNIEAMDLAKISYTLMEGRHHFDCRCAVVIKDTEDAVRVLRQAEGNEKLPNLFKGRVPRDFTAQSAIRKSVRDLIEQSHNDQENPTKYRESLYALAEFYCLGYEVSCQELFDNGKLKRVSLPTYPFAKEEYWMDYPEEINPLSVVQVGSIHPLLHQNTSDLSEQRYSSIFTGNEFFLADHIIKGKRTLPGVAFLEIVRAAVQHATGGTDKDYARIKLQNVGWVKPITITDQPVQVNIGLYPKNSGEIAYEVYTETDDTAKGFTVHSQGSAVLVEGTKSSVLDLNSIKAQCTETISSTQCYETFERMQMQYGPGHRGVEEIRIGKGIVFAKVKVPDAVKDTVEQYVLHPSIMDGIFQASIGFAISSGDTEIETKPSLPFAIDELEVYSRCHTEMRAIIRNVQGRDNRVIKYDIDLCDGEGNICARIKGYTSRMLDGSIGEGKPIETKIMEIEWKEAPISRQTHEYSRHIVFYCDRENIPDERQYRAGGISTLIRSISLNSSDDKKDSLFKTYAGKVFKEIKDILADRDGGSVLLQIIVPGSEEGKLYSGMVGMLRTACQENPKLSAQFIEIDAEENNADIISIIKSEKNNPEDKHIRYINRERYVAEWKQVKTTEKAELPWKDGGTYLITGGAGGLGLIFAKEAAQKIGGGTLILTGRSQENDRIREHLTELQEMGMNSQYRQVDVSDRKQVEELISSIVKQDGGLDGIIHSAGIIKDNYIIKKTQEEFIEVLEPKVSGIVNIDEASADLDMDFFIIFSSISGSLGNPGQSDYAAANEFMSAYAGYRNKLVAKGQRKGKTQSVNWPLWKEGGMGIGEEKERIMERNTGFIAMPTDSGIKAFYDCWATDSERVLCLTGNIDKIIDGMNKQEPYITAVQVNASQEERHCEFETRLEFLKEKTANYLKKVLSEVLKLPASRIETNAPMEKYGIDSILVLELTTKLESIFGTLPKTLFYEYQTLWELSGYFLASYREQLNRLMGIEVTEAPRIETISIPEKKDKSIQTRRKTRFMNHQEPEAEKSAREAMDIAIVGVSGKYPMAENVQEYWDNLRDGKDCITEIPKDRWDYRLYFDQNLNKTGKTYSKWGGFIDGVKHFDPLFFNISPREAETMDPQERLFLECVYETLEDAGYTPEMLRKNNGSGLGGDVGVYVGVMYEEYQLYGAQAQSQGRPITLSGSAASIANRVSYYFNFHGPSMAVDTMCSSSLTSIHLACQALQQDGCEAAIAGGVNVSIHPNKYLMLSQGKFVSSNGKCLSFGEGGDGYVPGEGIGAVMLKKLSKAIEDGDHIYGVIKETALNHGGKTNGYTVPNPNAQSEVIRKALKRAGINPRTISYIEAHGTGTSLGDPIEISGLTQAFREYTDDKQFCAIGSAKSNIGHCESAAGIAGITKVLMQMKHGEIAPSLHSKSLNPYIDFENSPFEVPQYLRKWKRPVIKENGAEKEYPRRAGISAFGAGGSNAHVIIEEYRSEDSIQKIPSGKHETAVIILSAKSSEQLKERARRLHAEIKQNKDEDLASIAYTLQVGREAMEYRMGMLVSGIQQLEGNLAAFLEGRTDIEDFYQGYAKSSNGDMAIFANDEDIVKVIELWGMKGKYRKLVDYWVKGFDFDWGKLYHNTKPRRVSLPVYPFMKEEYWVTDIPESQPLSNVDMTGIKHPLLHQNISDINGQRFSSWFTGREKFFKQGINEGDGVLLEGAHIEVARIASSLYMNNHEFTLTLRDVTWNKPAIVNKDSSQIQIALYEANDGEVEWEIYGENDIDREGHIVSSEGKAVFMEMITPEILDLNALREIYSHNVFSNMADAADTHSEFTRYIEELWSTEELAAGETNELLIKFSDSISNENEEGKNPIIFEPAILDSCLHAFHLYSGNFCYGAKAVSMEEAEFIVGSGSYIWGVVRVNKMIDVHDTDVLEMDIDFCDEHGNLLSYITGLRYISTNQGETGADPSLW
ncbi:SDR family NAD(P)-dependent oxidoreductase [Bacillus atrophaeus]|uniref:SDR family NAD(P)-dependent oxidoreductase n=4 Tax=Bacillus atrophaeus TaxID=1452 RepID=UPI002DB9E5EC|nr:SDR family NAD(P)-dependent oxidoreductase [Bacillus atrophaeus]MEC0760749.1 SDR family NAD(P)-dependent oxidoreductase [Bacillus atrophaeus]